MKYYYTTPTLSTNCTKIVPTDFFHKCKIKTFVLLFIPSGFSFKQPNSSKKIALSQSLSRPVSHRDSDNSTVTTVTSIYTEKTDL